MILSICLAAFVPLMAYSWHHHGEPPVFSLPDVHLSPLQQTPPHSPPSEGVFFPSQRQRTPKLGNFWMKGKGKRTIQTVTAAPTTSSLHLLPAAPASRENDAAHWVNSNHQERRFIGYREDHFLEEQVHVPSGAQLTWYKDNMRLLRQGGSDSAINSVSQDLSESSASSSSFVRISSAVYIDCAVFDDAGFYRLEVLCPNGNQILHRNFTVIVVDLSGVPGVSCRHGRNVMAYVPRIYQYAPFTQANEGDRIILPCGYQGLLTSVDWYRNDNLVLPEDANHEKRPNGDLVIQHLSGGPGRARYACRVNSTEYNIEGDVTVTDVYIQE